MKRFVLVAALLFSFFVPFGIFADAAVKDVEVAQLVLVTKRVKVIKVDTMRNRVEVAETGKKDDSTLLYLVVDGYTKTRYQGKSISWQSLKPGQLLLVKGGLRWDGKIRAKSIELIKKNP